MIAAALVASFAGCQSSAPPSEVDGALYPVSIAMGRSQLHVVVQLCYPQMKVAWQQREVDLSGYGQLPTYAQSGLQRGAAYPLHDEDPASKEVAPVQVRTMRTTFSPQWPGPVWSGAQMSRIELYSEYRMLSAGGLDNVFVDSTTSGQGVFEVDAGLHADIVGLGAAPRLPGRQLVGGAEYANYWFQVPRVDALSIGMYSPWQGPVSVESLDQMSRASPVAWEHGAGRGTPISVTTEDMPRMRFMLIAEEDRFNQGRTMRRLTAWSRRNDSGAVYKLASASAVPPCGDVGVAQ